MLQKLKSKLGGSSKRSVKPGEEIYTPSGLRKWLPLAVLSMAILIIVIDTTLLNVSLGTIIRELHTNIQALQWVITAYALTLAALTITGGRLGDLFGRKKMFVIGAVIFAVGSTVASMSHSVGLLLIGESIIEGVGAALMMPATASLLVSTYRGRDRAIALGVWGGMAAAGSAIGPILGGWLTSQYSWRWGFRINIFVAIVLVLGSIIVHETRDREEKPTLDWIGVFLSSFGLFLGVFGIIEAGKYGWIKALEPFTLGGLTLGFGSISVVVVAMVLSAIFLTAFYFWEQHITKRGRTPLVNMALFKNRQFTSGSLTMGLMTLGQIGLIFALPVFLQGVRGLDALHTGIAQLPLSLALMVAALLSGFLSGRFMPKRIIQFGLFVEIVGLVIMRFTLGVDASIMSLAPGLAIYGFGIGLSISALSNVTLSAVNVNESGEASGVNNTIRQVGSSLGSAIIGAVLLASLTSGLVAGVNNSSILQASNKQVIAEEISQQASAIEFGAKIQSQQVTTPEEQAEIKRISNEATTHASRTALIVTITSIGLALLMSVKLPATKNIERNESAAAGAH